MRLLIGLLFFCTTTTAQITFSKDSSFVKTIKELPSGEPFDTAHSYTRVKDRYVFIISDKELYELFGYETALKFNGFEFAKYHILGRMVCPYCEVCEYDKPCHRNACQYEWTWVMRENKKAFSEIPSTTLGGHVDADLPEGRRSFFSDTILSLKKDTTVSNWYTHGHGDCFAKFEYKVFKDNFYPVVILKEWNYWGGCRAGGSWDFTISFIKPDGILQYSKNTILAEKNYDYQ